MLLLLGRVESEDAGGRLANRPVDRVILEEGDAQVGEGRTAMRRAERRDMTLLAPFAARMFTEKFGHMYRPQDLQSHLEKSCSEAYFVAEFSLLFFVFVDTFSLISGPMVIQITLFLSLSL